MQSARQDMNSLAARILRDATPDEAVILAWPLACGSGVARRTKALTFANGTLYVRVPDAGWKAQLEAFSARYSQKLTELSGATVKEISYEVYRSASSDDAGNPNENYR